MRRAASPPGGGATSAGSRTWRSCASNGTNGCARGSTAKLDIARAEASGKAVIEAEGLSKAYDGMPVVRDFSTRIRRGDRIGLIGPNGAGKTTLARLLIGDLAPDAGTVKLGTKLAPLYYDQRRESLDGTATLWRTLVPDGGDSILVGDRQRHVVSYLRDFLFDESQARQPVRTLSGGEKNRLLLARLFARPSNLLVLDEPTNDLDLETLDLLQEVLDDYPGTIILISHDRDFLDRLVTGVIALEGNGQWREVVGGYADYQREVGRREAAAREADAGSGVKRDKPGLARAPRRASKLSHKDQRALEALPGEIEHCSAPRSPGSRPSSPIQTSMAGTRPPTKASAWPTARLWPGARRRRPAGSSSRSCARAWPRRVNRRSRAVAPGCPAARRRCAAEDTPGWLGG